MRHRATLAEDGTIALPPEIRRILGVAEGDTIVFETTQHGVQVVGEEASDPFLRYQGIWRVGEGKSHEEIIEEIREMRGWDEYDRNLPDDDDDRG